MKMLGPGSIVALLAALSLSFGEVRAAPIEKVLHRFKGTDGANPVAGLIFDPAGSLYGTTYNGGRGTRYYPAQGTVFELTHPTAGQSIWTEKVLHNFFNDIADGVNPAAGLVRDAAGNLYGTTYYGTCLICGFGKVFEVSPPAAGKTAWTETVIYAFDHTGDGSGPRAGLIFDNAGNLYGTNEGDSFHNIDGTVFALMPPVVGQTVWTETVLHYIREKNGAVPHAGLIFDSAGNLYGTTSGGRNLSACPSAVLPGCGTVFELSPPTTGQTRWSDTVLHGFRGPSRDGAGPEAGVIFDAAGNLYGTTSGNAGTSGYGTVFKLTPPAAGQTRWTETVLHRFRGGNDGAGPQAGVIFDAAGNLYGTTSNGGGASGYGTVFELIPPAAGQTRWTETVLHRFKGGNDGADPRAGVILDAAGNLYGTTFSGGGASGYGTVFEVTP